MKPGRPTATIDIDGQTLTAPEAALVRLRVDLALGNHAATELTFWRNSKFSSTTAGGKVEVSLGTDGSDTLVFTGQVDHARTTESVVIINVIGATAALNLERRSQTFVQQTAADIVRDLAGSVSVDSVEGDLELFAYAVDARRTVWQHLTHLARLSGADIGSTADGALMFTQPKTGMADHTLYFGAALLDWDFSQRPEPAVPKVVPNGAASEAGREKWHWLLNDPSGGSDPARLVGSFHSRDATDALTKVLEARAKRATVKGSFTAVGDPEIRPGDLVKLKDLPTTDPGLLRVLSVRHTLDGRSGFLTNATAESAGGGGFPL